MNVGARLYISYGPTFTISPESALNSQKGYEAGRPGHWHIFCVYPQQQERKTPFPSQCWETDSCPSTWAHQLLGPLLLLINTVQPTVDPAHWSSSAHKSSAWLHFRKWFGEVGMEQTCGPSHWSLEENLIFIFPMFRNIHICSRNLYKILLGSIFF